MRGHTRSIENDLCTSCACVCARAPLRYVRLLYLPSHRKRRKLPIPLGSLLNHAGYLLASQEREKRKSVARSRRSFQLLIIRTRFVKVFAFSSKNDETLPLIVITFFFIYRPPGDAWNRLATMANLLDKLNYTRTVLIQAKDAEGREDGKIIIFLINI